MQNPRFPPISILTLGLLASCTAAATAQTVTGTVRDQATAHAVPGALVVLLDPAGTVVHGTLSNQDGRYLVRAPAPGRYTVRAERIGYGTAESAVLDLAADERLVLDLEAPPLAIALEGLVAQRASSCRATPATAAAAQQVWDEARKALRSAAWAERDRTYWFSRRLRDERFDPRTHLLLAEAEELSGGWLPFAASADAAAFAERGWIWYEPEHGWLMNGPDPEVLLSDEFRLGHCLDLVAADDGSDRLVGVAFWPLPRVRRPDIRGTAWLDRQTLALERIDFAYVNLPWMERDPVPIPTDWFGGSIHFGRRPDGAWVATRWHIGGGRFSLYPTRDNRALVRLDQLQLRTAEVLEMYPAGMLSGRLVERATRTPIEGARVLLVDADRDAVTDGCGVFDFGVLRAGTYRLTAAAHADEAAGAAADGARAGVADAVELAIEPGAHVQVELLVHAPAARGGAHAANC